MLRLPVVPVVAVCLLCFCRVRWSHGFAAPSGRSDLRRAPCAAVGIEAGVNGAAQSNDWSHAIAGVTLVGLCVAASLRRKSSLSLQAETDVERATTTGSAKWPIRLMADYQFGEKEPGAPLALPQWMLTVLDDGSKFEGKKLKGPPKWLTLAKWQSMPRDLKRRSFRYWMRVYDDNGNLCYDPSTEYTIPEAIRIFISMYERVPRKSDTPFCFRAAMNLDYKQPDQQLRTNISLPNGSGKEVRVGVFCADDEEKDVLELGAAVAGKTLVDQIENDNIQFDVLLTKASMMPRLAKLGKVLGPKKLMPSPKAGTVVMDWKAGIESFKSGASIEIRTNKDSVIELTFGALSQGLEKLVGNCNAVLNGIVDKRPAGATKDYFKQVKLFTTCGPSLRIRKSEFPLVA